MLERKIELLLTWYFLKICLPNTHVKWSGILGLTLINKRYHENVPWLMNIIFMNFSNLTKLVYLQTPNLAGICLFQFWWLEKKEGEHFSTPVWYTSITSAGITGQFTAKAPFSWPCGVFKKKKKTGTFRLHQALYWHSFVIFDIIYFYYFFIFISYQ